MENIKSKTAAFLKKFFKNDLVRIISFLLVFFILSAELVLFFDIKSKDPNNIKNLWDAMWWSWVTITTTGYGDYTPKSVMGRLVAMFTMITGVVFVGIVTGRIASFLVEKALIERRGLMDLSKLKHHFVICGWKKNMEKVLADILFLNAGLSADLLVVIANIAPEAIELFQQQNPDLSDVNILRGEHYNENMLNRANVKNARKILILSDESEAISPTEADSRTVIAAMTLNKIVRSVPICAELLDKKFEPYLLNAHVDEIIYSNEYSRALVANASASTGIAKVLNVLLDTQSQNILCARPIPAQYIGKPFKDLRDGIEDTQHCIVLGLLENIGNFYDRKREALKEAQKTPDISKLVRNLASVKEMENNRPHLNPPEDYSVPENAHVILITNRKEAHANHQPAATR